MEEGGSTYIFTVVWKVCYGGSVAWGSPEVPTACKRPPLSRSHSTRVISKITSKSRSLYTAIRTHTHTHPQPPTHTHTHTPTDGQRAGKGGHGKYINKAIGVVNSVQHFLDCVAQWLLIRFASRVTRTLSTLWTCCPPFETSSYKMHPKQNVHSYNGPNNVPLYVTFTRTKRPPLGNVPH